MRRTMRFTRSFTANGMTGWMLSTKRVSFDGPNRDPLWIAYFVGSLSGFMRNVAMIDSSLPWVIVLAYTSHW